MISNRIRSYDYYTYGDNNEYGQPKLSETAQGTIKMAISVMTKFVQDNVQYSNTNYIGLTLEDINDKYVIQYEDKKLKVLYVIYTAVGRYKQVFMSEM